jgi:copper chaperone NosL
VTRRTLLLWLLLAAACRRSEGPEPIAYDRAACVHCRMLISDPAFAAQLQTTDGEVLDFDDPGCLLRYRAEHEPRVRAAWFHHLREDRWLPATGVGFERIDPTPMGWGLGAVDAGAAGALSLAAAEAIVREGPHAPR